MFVDIQHLKFNQKFLGGVGALLIPIGRLIFFIDNFSKGPCLLWNLWNILGSCLEVIGLILILLSIHNYSKLLKTKIIFQKILWAFLVVLFLRFLGIIGVFVPIKFIFTKEKISENPFMFIIFLAIFLFLLLTFIILLARLYRSAFKEMGNRLSNNLFILGGNFLYYGVLLYILFIGIPVELIGWIIISIAFLKIPKEIQIHE